MSDTAPGSDREPDAPRSPEQEPRHCGVHVSAWIALVLSCAPASFIGVAIFVSERAPGPATEQIRTLVTWGWISFVPALMSLAWASLHASIAGVRAPVALRLAVAGLCVSVLSVFAIVVIALSNPPFR